MITRRKEVNAYGKIIQIHLQFLECKILGQQRLGNNNRIKPSSNWHLHSIEDKQEGERLNKDAKLCTDIEREAEKWKSEWGCRTTHTRATWD